MTVLLAFIYKIIQLHKWNSKILKIWTQRNSKLMEVNKCDSPAWCHQREASYETKWAMTRRKVTNIYSETTLRKDACPISPSIYKISPLVNTLSGNQGVEIWEVWPYTQARRKTQAPQHISSRQNIPTADQQKTFPSQRQIVRRSSTFQASEQQPTRRLKMAPPDGL